MSFVFDPKQPYRIQNVDYQHYLAVKDPQIGSKVIMRPHEENNRQKWSFVAVTRNAYHIRNVATEVLPHPLYLTFDSGRVVCKSYRPGLSVWTVFKNARGDAYGIITYDTETNKDKYLASEDGTIGTVEEQPTNNNILAEDRTWRIETSSDDSPSDSTSSSAELPNDSNAHIPTPDNATSEDKPRSAEPPPPAYSGKATPPRPSTPPPKLSIRGHTDRVYCASFSRDGKYIVSGSDSDVRIWDVQTGNSVLGPLKTIGTAWCVAFSPDGSRIAAGLGDNTILIWNAVTGETVGTLKGHTSPVLCVDFSPDGTKLVSGSYDRTIWIWHAELGRGKFGPIEGHTDYVRSVVFSGDGKRIASCSHKEMMVTNAKSGDLLWKASPETIPNWIAFSPDAQTVVSVERSSTVLVWNADKGTRVERDTECIPAVRFTSSAGSNYSSALSPDGRWRADKMGNTGNGVRIFDLQTGEAVDAYQHPDYVCSIAFSPDSKRVLSASYDKTIQVYTPEC